MKILKTYLSKGFAKAKKHPPQSEGDNKTAEDISPQPGYYKSELYNNQPVPGLYASGR